MRRFSLLPCLAAAAMVSGAAAGGARAAAAAAPAAPARAQVATGGASTPAGLSAPSRQSGGTPYRKRTLRKARRPSRRRPAGPVLASFGVRRARLFLFGAPARVSFRITGRARLAAVRISLTRRGARRAAATIALGPRKPGRRESVLVSGREAGVLPQGSYRLRISARDVRGRRLRRGAGASSTSTLSLIHHRFPLAGPFTYGGAEARFGAGRSGHSHQGQDLAAAEGTPVLAPRGGVVKTVRYQARGAGHYVVLDGAGEQRDYVFMHLRTGSIPVAEGQTVRTGQRIGAVGNTGRSFGAHLHFEVWDGRGWYEGGRPVDPLPLLMAWERLTRSPA